MIIKYGTHVVLLGLQDNCETFLVGGWHNSNGFLVHQTIVTEWAHIFKIVHFLKMKSRLIFSILMLVSNELWSG